VARADRHTESAHRRAQVLTARLAGATFEQIGRSLGITRQRAHQLYLDAMRQTVQEPAEQLRELEAARLDHLQARLTPLLGQPGQVIPAALALLKVQESRRRLFGLDAPARVTAAVTLRDVSVDDIDEELARLQAELDGLGPPTPPQVEQDQDADVIRGTCGQAPAPDPVPPPPAPAAMPETVDVGALIADALEAALDALGIPDTRRGAAYQAAARQLEKADR
jgi:hypothetical protein